MLIEFTKRLRIGTTVAAIAFGVGTGAAHAQNLTLLGGSSGGTWDALSGAMKGVIENNLDGARVSVRPGGGISNLQAIATDKAEIAWMLANNANDAIAGREPFGEPVTNLCTLASFHPTDLHLITVDDSVQSIEDFRGKRVGTLPRGTGTEAVARLVLELSGIEESEVDLDYASQGDLGNMMKDGHLDVWIQLSGVPGGAVADLMASNSSARIVPVSDELLAALREQNVAWNRETLVAGTYPGQDEEVPTAGYMTALGASCTTVSDDTAYEVTKAIIADYADLGTVNHSISELSVEDLARDIGVPLHPGARRAYEEAGVTLP